MVYFIEQCWGAAKYRYWMLPLTTNEAQMEHNVWECLNSVDILKIRRYANRLAHFMHAYHLGLNSMQAAWANKKYHGHRVLPETLMKAFDSADN
ncbi:hypothetical protein K439DRAFT_1349999 [Ramaria rubella]|nr:hypothetical protein K439DRAFT_1349999 [Ramaria rubella]